MPLDQIRLPARERDGIRRATAVVEQLKRLVRDQLALMQAAAQVREESRARVADLGEQFSDRRSSR